MIQSAQNPYPGLRPFEREDADYFFGRETHTEELLVLLGRTRFLALVGTSGSGKSSLVRAGLFPALYGDMLEGTGSHWRIAIFRPGEDPIRSLAEELFPALHGKTSLADGGNFNRAIFETTLRRSSRGLVEAVAQSRCGENVLIVVDQFEELFRFHNQAADRAQKDEAAAFVKILLEAVADPDYPVYVLITIRSDFIGDCARFRDLPEAVNHGLYLVPRLTRDQLRHVIEGPAAVAGGSLSPALVEQLLNEIGDDQDQLPVLQHALMRTWRPNGVIGVDEYEGMETALSSHADEAMKHFSTPEQQGLMRKLFQCITEKGPDQREVRRPTRFGDIRRICGEVNEASLKEMIEWLRAAGRSFLMPPALEPITDDTFIDISHESLIRKWATLKQWVNEEAESADTYRRLARSADLHRRGREDLWRDPGLQLALEQKERESWNEAWGNRYARNYTEALGFLEESRQRRESDILEKETQRKKELKRTRIFAGILGVAFIVALGLAAYAYNQRKSADEQRQAAIEQKENADKQRQVAEQQSIIASNEAIKAEKAKIAADEAAKVARQAEDKTKLALKSAREEKVAAEKQRQLAEASERNARGALQQATTLRLAIEGPAIVTQVRPGSTLQGALLARVAHRYQLGGEAYSGLLVIRDYLRQTSRIIDIPDFVLSVAFSPDGKRIVSVSSDNTLRLWDASTGNPIGEPLKGPTGPVRSVAFSPDGKRIVSVSSDNTLRLWDASTGNPIGEPLKGNRGPVVSVAFSPDGRRIVSVSFDNTLRLWDASTGSPIGEPLKGPTGQVRSVAISPDGRRIVSVSFDNTLRLWDASTGNPIGEPLKGPTGPVMSVTFSPDGGRIVSGSFDNTLRLWDASTGSPIGDPLKGHTGPVRSVAFSPDGRRIVSVSFDNTLRLWDASTGNPIGEPLKGPTGAPARSVAYSPDGKRIVSVSSDNTLRLWDASTGNPIGEPLKGPTGPVQSVAFSPDGRRIVSGSFDTLRLWDASTGNPIGEPLKGNRGPVVSVAFSPDGRRIVSGSFDTLRLWDASTGNPIGEPLKGHTGPVQSVAFSPDGRRIVSGSSDTTLRLWDAGTGNPIGEPLRGHTRSVRSVAFSPNGKHIVSGGEDNTLRRWPTPETLNAEVCAKLLHNMTRGEWRRWVGDIPYRRQCPELPGPPDDP